MKSESDIFIDDAQVLLNELVKNPLKEFIRMPPSVTPELSLNLTNIDFEFLYKVKSSDTSCVWKGETTDGKYVTIESLNDYVAIGIGYTSYERDDNIRLVGLGNHIDMQNIDVILNKLNINKPDVYHDFGW